MAVQLELPCHSKSKVKASGITSLTIHHSLALAITVLDSDSFPTSPHEPILAKSHAKQLRLLLAVLDGFHAEGSAMIEVASKIASGASFKFNSGCLGERASRRG